MVTPSLVIVGAPHFFSRTTLRPLGPSVTLTASASWFMPRSSARRASSSNAMILAMRWNPSRCDVLLDRSTTPATDGPRPIPRPRHLVVPICHSTVPSARPIVSTLPRGVQAGSGRPAAAWGPFGRGPLVDVDEVPVFGEEPDARSELSPVPLADGRGRSGTPSLSTGRTSTSGQDRGPTFDGA